MRNLLYILIGILASGCTAAGQEHALFRADDPAVRYVGRVAVSDGDVSFDWSGTYFETVFTGDRFAVRVSDSKKNYYNVFVDDQPAGIITTEGSRTLVTVAEGLADGQHRLRLQKRTEGEQGTTTIHGFELAPGGMLNPVSPSSIPTRHIEFIGNSLTAGYGTEGKSKDEPFLPETENCNYAYSCITARYFDADYTLIAHSGRGAVRNYGDSLTVSHNTMKDRMMCTFDENPDVKWDFEAEIYKPDIVVINLGTNDYSTRPYPSREDFTGAYSQIVSQLRDAYGDVPVLCVGPRLGEPVSSYVREFVTRLDDPNVHYAAILPGTYNAGSDLGSTGHPNYTGQKKMAMALIPHISTITGWEIANRIIE